MNTATIYVRVVDLVALEAACPPGADRHLDVQIVSDLAWSSAEEGSLVVCCSLNDYATVRSLLPNGVLPQARQEEELNDIRRRFGC